MSPNTTYFVSVCVGGWWHAKVLQAGPGSLMLGNKAPLSQVCSWNPTQFKQMSAPGLTTISLRRGSYCPARGTTEGGARPRAVNTGSGSGSGSQHPKICGTFCALWAVPTAAALCVPWATVAQDRPSALACH